MLNKFIRWNSVKPITLLLSLLLIFGMVVSGSFAYLFVYTSTLNNAFSEAYVTCSIEESFNRLCKSSIKVKNTGNIDAWIRVALVPTWEDDNQMAVNQKVNEEKDEEDLIIIISDSWFKGTDGYYYCRDKISPGKSTPELLASAISVNTSSEGYLAGYHMNLQVLCEAIQSEPDTTVTSVWPVTVSGGKLS